MSTRAKASRAELTDYEDRQVRAIAAWKAEHPNPVAELFRVVTQPVARAAEQVIPDSAARKAIEAAYSVSDKTALREVIAAQAGVSDIAELRHRTLEECDRLAERVGLMARGIGFVEGAATGAGGVWTTLLDVPLLFGLALRTIIQVGHCYGYPLDQSRDKAFVLGVLVAALSNSRERRRKVLARLREIEDLLLEEAQENLVVEEAASLLFQIEVLEDIPMVGAASGAVLNFSVARRAEITARRIFQERWLRDNGKVEHIEPAPDLGRIPAGPGWTGVLGRFVYRGCYYLGYGASLPVCYVASIFAPRESALARGMRDGATAAVESVDHMVGRLQGALGNGQVQPAREGSPAPA